MRLIVFRSCGRQRPQASVKIKFVPPYARNFVTPLPRERQQFDEWPECPAQPSAAAHTRRSSSSLKTRSRARSAVGGFTPAQGEVARMSRATHQLKNLAYSRKHAVRGNGCAAVNDTVEHVEHVAAGDFVHHAPTPAGPGHAAEASARFPGPCSWTVRAPHVPFEKLFENAVDAVGLGGAGENFSRPGSRPSATVRSALAASPRASFSPRAG